MTIPAYDESYLDSMMQKTRYLFRIIARNSQQAFDVITDYMISDYREYMDMGNPLYLNKTPKQILSSIGFDADFNAEISDLYDEFIFDWMADIYTLLQWQYGLWSKDIVKRIPPGILYKKYNPLHEASLENGIRKLYDIYMKK
ncbi:MAG TPA: hypothetical protein IAB46_13765 [Candidatus Scybalocola faecigallinarum]|uniref:Uncharacterized protein n=1 Tax=Candidatus Scybalocola faecigallinarum TaxID=2840941 RepID=A0A9D1F6X7_9FIRM|nr:hypothetical protein [Candidatus Scybalocola faecigallinarum]